MIGLLLAVTIVVAVAAVARRRFRRARLARAARSRPGASGELAIHVRSYGEVDDHLGRRWCACGGFLERTGEGSRVAAGRRLRVVRMVCQECERVDEVFFDTTDVLH